MINYYELLEVSEKASKEVIEKAYKALAKKYHPDLNQDNKKEAELQMKQINEAYDVLIDDTKRANYDSVLQKKRTLENRKIEQHTQNNSSTVQNQNPDYYEKDNTFYVNTTGLDEKTKKKLQQKLQERYLEAYDAYLRERGYKLKYKWTFKRIMTLIITIVTTIIVFTILFFIPPIHNYCIQLYEENIIIRFCVNLVSSFFKAIFSIFKH